MELIRPFLIKLYNLYWHYLIAVLKNPTLLPPPSYRWANARKVYGEAFRRCVEFIRMNHVEGDIAEFGTFNGYTARKLAVNMKKFRIRTCLHLFDSFEGLPIISSPVDNNSYEVKDLKVWCKGSMSAGSEKEKQIFRVLLPYLSKDRLKIYKGYFSDTLKRELFNRKLALIHIDCDLYQSAYEVLSKLVEWRLLQDGAILICDDYNCSRGNPNFGERKAISEVFNNQAPYSLSPYLSYGWNGSAFIVHDKSIIPAFKQ